MGVFIAAVIVLLTATAIVGATPRGFDRVAQDAKAAAFVSPTGNDDGRCTQAAPCASFSRAYRIARPGDTVSVAPGVYPTQVIDYIPGRDSAAKVVFVSAGTVAIEGNLEARASGIHLAGRATGSIANWRQRRYSFRVSGYTSVAGDSPTQFPRNVTIEGLDTGNLDTASSENVVIRDVDVGPRLLDAPCNFPENRIGPNGDAFPKVPTNLIWDRVVVHGQNRTQAAADSGCHYGGVIFYAGSGITIRNSVFSQNVVYNISVGPIGGVAAPTRVVLENNWFGCPVDNSYVPNGSTTCNGQGDVQFSGVPYSGWLVRFNSFNGGLSIADGAPTFANFRVIGNVGPGRSCLPAASYSFNAWTSSGCSPSDVRLPRPPFVSTQTGNEDFTLIRGTRAIELVGGAGSDYRLRTDIQGRQRPVYSKLDAGAEQRETAEIVLGRSIGEVRLGMKRKDALAFYGRSRVSSSAGLVLDTFRLHGARLELASSKGRIVRVATTSPYYTTPAGIGVGSRVARAGILARGAWLQCAHAFRRTIGRSVVHVTTDTKRRRIVRVTITSRAHEPTC